MALSRKQRDTIERFNAFVVEVAAEQGDPVMSMQLKDFFDMLLPLYELKLATETWTNVYGPAPEDDSA